MSSIVVTPLDTSEKFSLETPKPHGFDYVRLPTEHEGIPGRVVPWVSTRALERMHTMKKKRKTDQIHKNRRKKEKDENRSGRTRRHTTDDA